MPPGYGFVDFEQASAAEQAKAALQAKGIQAQMAKVSLLMCFTLWSLFVGRVQISDQF